MGPRQAEAVASTTRAFYRGALLRGLTPGEAGNLTAVTEGLAIGVRPWTLHEIDHLLFLRHLVETGRIPVGMPA